MICTLNYSQNLNSDRMIFISANSDFSLILWLPLFSFHWMIRCRPYTQFNQNECQNSNYRSTREKRQYESTFSVSFTPSTISLVHYSAIHCRWHWSMQLFVNFCGWAKETSECLQAVAINLIDVDVKVEWKLEIKTFFSSSSSSIS